MRAWINLEGQRKGYDTGLDDGSQVSVQSLGLPPDGRPGPEHLRTVAVRGGSKYLFLVVQWGRIVED